jgi:hypothetical protein
MAIAAKQAKPETRDPYGPAARWSRDETREALDIGTPEQNHKNAQPHLRPLPLEHHPISGMLRPPAVAKQRETFQESVASCLGFG